MFITDNLQDIQNLIEKLNIACNNSGIKINLKNNELMFVTEKIQANVRKD